MAQLYTSTPPDGIIVVSQSISSNTVYDLSLKFNGGMGFRNTDGYSIEMYLDCDIPLSTNPKSYIVIEGKGHNYTSLSKYIATEQSNIIGVILNMTDISSFIMSTNWTISFIIGKDEPPLILNNLVLKAIPYKIKTENNYTRFDLSKIDKKMEGTMLLGADTFNWVRQPTNITSQPILRDKSGPKSLEPKIQNITEPRIAMSESRSQGAPPYIFILIIFLILGGVVAFILIKKPKTTSSITAFGQKLAKISKGR